MTSCFSFEAARLAIAQGISLGKGMGPPGTEGETEVKEEFDAEMTKVNGEENEMPEEKETPMEVDAEESKVGTLKTERKIHLLGDTFYP